MLSKVLTSKKALLSWSNFIRVVIRVISKLYTTHLLDEMTTIVQKAALVGLNMGKNKNSKETSNKNNTKREIKLKHRKDKKLNISKKMNCEDKDHLFQPKQFLFDKNNFIKSQNQLLPRMGMLICFDMGFCSVYIFKFIIRKPHFTIF